MGIVQRRAREKEELRERILAAAARLFVEQGYPNVSMRKIAERIEYAPSTIYLYFQDKDEICRTLCVDTFAKLTASLEQVSRRGLPPLEQLTESLRAYIRFGLDNPQEYLFTFTPPPRTETDGPSQGTIDAVLHSGERAFQQLRQGLAACMAVGVIRTQNVELAAQIVWSMMHGLTLLLAIKCDFPFLDHDVLVDALLDHIVRSLK